MAAGPVKVIGTDTDTEPGAHVSDAPYYRSHAWILSGIMNTPGILVLRDRRLSFVSDEGPVFDEPLSAVTDIRFPWYEFTGGFRATVAGTRRRISLVRPNGAGTATASMFDTYVGDAVVAAGAVHDIADGRRAGKAWRALLLDGAAPSAHAG
ncbi:hypothetical protein WIS52_31255 [Pseudonocardia nematodicida]|uniref:Uncharacterized protein n=1 Tax=Pseudonocardia nematodicida TaxID=1206997 RepID=A0ABV1KKJ4_9PSEU